MRTFIRELPKTLANEEDVRQLIRSSGSVGANYIEANESLGEKDTVMRMRIARKEAKEARYWLDLVDCGQSTDLNEKRKQLHQEALELAKILGAIIKKLT